MPSKWMQSYMQKRYEDHKKRIREAKTTLAVGKPPDMPLSMRREIERKRVQNGIEQDNRLLLDRLAMAMSKKNIDNELREQTFTSYIEVQRKRELQKIGIQNKLLLSRIQNTVPCYRHLEWERDAEKRVEYLRNMTEFPDRFVPPITKFSSESQKKKARERQQQQQSQQHTGSHDHDVHESGMEQSELDDWNGAPLDAEHLQSYEQYYEQQRQQQLQQQQQQQPQQQQQQHQHPHQQYHHQSSSAGGKSRPRSLPPIQR